MTLNIIRKTQIHTQSVKHNKIPNSLNNLMIKTGQRNFTKQKKQPIDKYILCFISFFGCLIR